MTPLPANIRPDFTLLAKPTGAACNLACQYCFYLSKQQLYPGSSLRMPDEVLKAYIRQLLASQAERETCFAWQGGEPTLMGLEFFQRALELVKTYRKPGQKVTYSLQTNGTMLDTDWCAFFKQHNFLIGLSIDGTAIMHDAYRVNKGGQGSFDQVRRGWDLLQKHRVDTNILCAVHAANASHPLKTYHFFRDNLGAHFIQFIPIVEYEPFDSKSSQETEQLDRASGKPIEITSEKATIGPLSVKPEQYGVFLIEIFEEWLRHDVGQIFIQNFDTALASWCGLPSSVCIFQEVCGRSLILEHNGDLYSCDHFVEPAHCLGNILEKPLPELVRSDQQRRFGMDKRNQLSYECCHCDVLFACHGECPRNRFVKASDGKIGLNYLCPSYKLFFTHIDRPMRTMAEMLRLGKPAADIMRMAVLR